jgi:arginase/agmatinase
VDVTTVLNTFFGALIDPAEADYVFLGVPFDGTSTYRSGAKNGPSAIRAASQHIESYCFIENTQIDAAKLRLADIGNIALQTDSIQKMLQSVESTVNLIHQIEKIPIILGGEHTLSLGAIRALPRDVVVIQFDAHPDLRDRYQDNPFSHACVMRRVVEILGSENLIQIGLRAVSKEEYEYFQAQDITYYTMNDIQQEGAEEIANQINSALPPGPPLYLSIDMDVVDPAFAPAVGNPEAGGLTTLQLLTILQKLTPRAIALDLTEVTPQYDQGITAVCAARIIKTFLCTHASHHGKRCM